LPPPDDAEVARVTKRIVRRIVMLLEGRGLGPEADSEDADPLSRDEPLLAALYGASVHGRIATGPRVGLRVAERRHEPFAGSTRRWSETVLPGGRSPVQSQGNRVKSGPTIDA